VTLAERLERNSQQEGECRVWVRSRNNQGYGRIKVEGRGVDAHRAAWIARHGYIPQGLCVLHRCDNPPCIRVDHLFIGTRGDNNRDRNDKGRSACGDRNGSRLYPERRPHTYGELSGMAKLTWDNVAVIREKYASGAMSKRALGRMFGVTRKTIRLVVILETWKPEWKPQDER